MVGEREAGWLWDRVRGIDGTPVLDVKPWMDEFAPIGATRQPAWSSELMRDYFKS